MTTMKEAPLTSRPAWKALASHLSKVRDLHLRALFSDDPQRGKRMTNEAAGIYLDYSKNRITDETVELLIQLAEECELHARIAAMFAGERINVTENRAVLHANAAVRAAHIHAMPVEDADLGAAAARYARELATIAGAPPVLDLVHLGLGPDGHTASLVAGDPVLDVVDRDVALTGAYLGRVRMTLTYPLLNRARRILWLVNGAEKTAMLAQLCAGDHGIPAGRVQCGRAVIVADAAAAGTEMQQQ